MLAPLLVILASAAALAQMSNDCSNIPPENGTNWRSMEMTNELLRTLQDIAYQLQRIADALQGRR